MDSWTCPNGCGGQPGMTDRCTKCGLYRATIPELAESKKPIVPPGTAPDPQGNWACTGCGSVNPAFVVFCACGAVNHTGSFSGFMTDFQKYLGSFPKHGGSEILPMKGSLGNNYTGGEEQPFGVVGKYTGDGLPSKMTRDLQVNAGKIAQRNKAVGMSKRIGDWTCPRCQETNFSVRNLCFNCQAPKPTGA